MTGVFTPVPSVVLLAFRFSIICCSLPLVLIPYGVSSFPLSFGPLKCFYISFKFNYSDSDCVSSHKLCKACSKGCNMHLNPMCSPRHPHVRFHWSIAALLPTVPPPPHAPPLPQLPWERRCKGAVRRCSCLLAPSLASPQTLSGRRPSCQETAAGSPWSRSAGCEGSWF